MLDRLDRYEIRREIGRGATATVYYAYDPKVGREVAIKLMLDPEMTNLSNHHRFEEEARAIATLEHPTIVPLYDFGEFEGQPYLVMRYMAGGSLTDRLRRGPIPMRETIIILSRVASALDRAHQRGIIHCDIKPDNILFDQYDSSFLSDFGIVKMPAAQALPADASDSGVSGTPAYMSPEQIQGKKLDGRCDVYSLGAMLYEILTGDCPFYGESALATALMHINEQPPSLLSARPDLSPQLDHIIQRAMSKQRHHRYPTAGALVRDLMATTGQGIKPVVDAKGSTLVVRPGGSKADGKSSSGQGTVRLPVLQGRKGMLAPAVLAGGLAIMGLIPILAITSTPSTASQLVKVENAIKTATTPATPIPIATPFGGGTGRIVWDSELGGVPDIYYMNADGSEVSRVITEVGNNRGADWSPDGKLLLFRSRNDENRVIFVMNPDGSALTPLTDPQTSNYWPVWSPDGSRIAFVSERDGNPEIYIMNADGTGAQRLTDHPAPDYEPAWSPDGSQIVFHSGRDGDLNIYRIDANGSNIIRLTNSDAADYEAVWSPDGRRIAFVSERDGDAEIYTMDADGTDQTRLTNNDSGDVAPAWSLDGAWIAFVARRDGNAEIYIMAASGSNAQRLTFNDVEDLNPSWQP